MNRSDRGLDKLVIEHPLRMISRSRVLSILSKHASDALKDGNIGKHYSDAYDEIENLPIMEV